MEKCCKIHQREPEVAEKARAGELEAQAATRAAQAQLSAKSAAAAAHPRRQKTVRKVG